MLDRDSVPILMTPEPPLNSSEMAKDEGEEKDISPLEEPPLSREEVWLDPTFMPSGAGSPATCIQDQLYNGAQARY